MEMGTPYVVSRFVNGLLSLAQSAERFGSFSRSVFFSLNVFWQFIRGFCLLAEFL